MNEAEISRTLREKYRRTIRTHKLRARYGRNWERLTAEVRRTREKLDILQDFQRDWEQRMIADFVEAKS